MTMISYAHDGLLFCDNVHQTQDTRPSKNTTGSTTSSIVMAVALAAVTPVAARIHSGLPVPLPVKKASSSAVSMR
ncbi:MAG: hypothetical protein PHI98_12665 [Eubacteriales bacterium]|nr:hypothetical protein [Eubacteriales bacterium]